MGVYYDCMKRPAEVIYNVASLFELPNETDISQLSNALREFVKAHSLLSTCCRLKDGNVVQVRHHEDVEIVAFSMTVQELENYKRDFVRSFDLSKGPLYRFSIVKTDANLYLLTDFHHLVLDGASLNLFVEDLQRALEGTMPTSEGYDYFNYASISKYPVITLL